MTTVACGTSPTPSATTTPRTAACGTGPASSSTATPGTQLWAQTWTTQGEGPPGSVNALVVSPNGACVVVAGSGPTIAYAAATGKRVWLVTEPALPDGAASLAASPDGSKIYVTGTSGGANGDYTTVAYNAATGARLWIARYDGPAKGPDSAASIVATGSLVVVDGTSGGVRTGTDFATVAYDATTGAQRWVSRYDGPAHGDEGWFPTGAHSLAVDTTGTTVYLTGGSASSASDTDYVTVAYTASTGALRWAARYGNVRKGQDVSGAVAVSPDGSTVVTTGFSESSATKSDFATVAYAAATGAQRWVARYNGPASQNEGAGAIAFRPGGDTVFVTGTSEGATVGHEDFATVAYAAATGAERWAKRYDGPSGGDDNAADLAVSTDGATLYVTGRTVPSPMLDEYATVAYAAATGDPRWVMTYGVPAGSANDGRASEAHAVDVSPKDGTVFVAGVSGRGYATIAYRG